ncbi:MAG: Gfo/Idh/MocA family protein [Vicinamibacterales bacterium]
MPSRPSRTRGRRIRYAVVGLGHIAQVAVLPAFAHARKNSTLHAIVSGDPEKLSSVGDAYHVPVRVPYDDYEAALAEVDAVYVASPNSLHAEHTIRAAREGVHVLCEKPLAVTDDDCRKMVEICRLAKVKLMTAYRLHFDPLTLEVLDLLRHERIGRVRYVLSSFSTQATLGGIRTRPDTGGGSLFDLGIYCINAARVVFGEEPETVAALALDGAGFGMPGVDETLTAILQYPGSRLATFTTSFAAADTSTLRIVGTEGDLHLEPAYEYAEGLRYKLTTKEKTVHRRGRKHDQFAAELLYFSDCILKDREPEPSGDEGARDVRIINALRESSLTGTAVTLSPLPREPQPEPAQAIDQPPVRKPELVNVKEPHE